MGFVLAGSLSGLYSQLNHYNSKKAEVNRKIERLNTAYKAIQREKGDRRRLSTQISDIYSDGYRWKGDCYNTFQQTYGSASKQNCDDVYNYIDDIADEILWEMNRLTDELTSLGFITRKILTAIHTWANG